MKKSLTGRVYQFLLVASFAAVLSEGNDGAKVNQVEFNEMCKIYRLTRAAPRRPELKTNPNIKAESEEIIDEIEKLDALTSSNGSYELLNSNKEWAEFEKETTKPPSLTEAKYKAWQGAIETSGLDPSKRGWGARYTRPAISSAVKIAHHKIEHLLAEARKLVSEIGKYESEIDVALGDANKNLCEAAFGKVKASSSGKDYKCPGSSAVNGETFADDGHAKGCQGTGGDETGISLANDIVCLCAQKSTPNTETYCGQDFRLGGGNYNNAGDADKLWEKINKTCALQGEKASYGVPTPDSIHKAIAAFQALLGKGAYIQRLPTTHETGVIGQNAILGHFVVPGTTTAISCDGAWNVGGGAHGLCVDYHQRLEGGKQIPWVERMEEAAGDLETAQAATEKASKAHVLLKGVERQARLAYLEAVHGGQFSTGLGPAGTNQSGDKQGTLTGGPTTVQGEKSSTTSNKALGITSFLQFLLLCGKVLRLYG